MAKQQDRLKNIEEKLTAGQTLLLAEARWYEKQLAGQKKIETLKKDIEEIRKEDEEEKDPLAEFYDLMREGLKSNGQPPPIYSTTQIAPSKAPNYLMFLVIAAVGYLMYRKMRG